MSEGLTLNALSLQLGTRCLCDQLSLQIQPGDCWAILGPNGSGKSTLLHTLAGLRSAAAGGIDLKGKSLAQLTRRQIAQQLGLLLQDSHDPFPATVYETVMTGRHPFLSRWQQEGREDHQRAEAALALLELSHMSQRMVHTLSGGERRRLGIATLVCQDPDIMLLDEPLNHLDLRHQQQLLLKIPAWQDQRKTLIMVLHEPNHALRFCNKSLLLYGDGRWQAGDTASLLQAKTLSELYRCRILEEKGQQRRWFFF